MTWAEAFTAMCGITCLGFVGIAVGVLRQWRRETDVRRLELEQRARAVDMARQNIRDRANGSKP